MNNLSTFQLFFMAILILLIIAGVLTFAFHGGVSHQASIGKVVIWGTEDQTTMDETLDTIRKINGAYNNITYVQKKPDNYLDLLVNAMASGAGPDLVLLPQDEMLEFANKTRIVPYSVMSQQTFTDSFIDEANMLMAPGGILGFPFMIDPLVMYWNRDIFSNAGLPRPPQTWSELSDETPKLSVIGSGNDISQSAIAMGEWGNVDYAKDIVSMLIIQAGDPIVRFADPNSGLKYTAVLGQVPDNAQEAPAVAALQYFTEFSDPSKADYTWSNAMPSSQDAFVAGNLAIYLGYASDYNTLLERNPNLNFGVSMVPQVQGKTVNTTYGRMTVLAIPRTAPNVSGAAAAAVALSSQAGIAAFVKASNLPPVRRDVAVDTSKNAAQSVFVQSGYVSRAWLDPGPSKTDGLFQDMVQSVVSGRLKPAAAIPEASQILQSMLSKL